MTKAKWTDLRFGNFKSYFFIGLIIAGIFIFYYMNKGDESEFIEQVPPTGQDEVETETMTLTADEEETPPVDEEMIVDIKGAVNQPGVYIAKTGERIIDIVERAGGFTKEADKRLVNLSQKVVDEMMIYIPKMGEEEVPSPPLSPSVYPGPAGNYAAGDGKVNINTADAAALETLPGIGPSKAEAILEYRNTNGPFQTVEDLMNVSGIGEKTFEKLKDKIMVQ